MERLSKGKSLAILVFSFTVLVLAVAAVKVSPHRIFWLIGLAALIPLFAAILGGISSRENS
jgi:hypothetical protein